MTVPSFQAHGKSAPGEHVGLSIDYFTLTTAVNIIPDGVFNSPTQVLFDQLVRTISLNGQPILSNMPTVASGVYTFTFAIDHTGSWATGAALVAAIQLVMAGTALATDGTLAVSVVTQTQNYMV